MKSKIIRNRIVAGLLAAGIIASMSGCSTIENGGSAQDVMNEVYTELGISENYIDNYVSERLSKFGSTNPGTSSMGADNWVPYVKQLFLNTMDNCLDDYRNGGKEQIEAELDEALRIVMKCKPLVDDALSYFIKETKEHLTDEQIQQFVKDYSTILIENEELTSSSELREFISEFSDKLIEDGQFDIDTEELEKFIEETASDIENTLGLVESDTVDNSQTEENVEGTED